MSILLGEEPERSSIRGGANDATFHASFLPDAKHPVWKFLSAQGLKSDTNSPIEIERVVGRDGKDDIKVNGDAMATEVLREMGLLMVEIHGQFAERAVALNPVTQMKLARRVRADRYILGNVARDYRDIIRYQRELDEERSFIATMDAGAGDRKGHQRPDASWHARKFL